MPLYGGSSDKADHEYLDYIKIALLFKDIYKIVRHFTFVRCPVNLELSVKSHFAIFCISL